MKDGVKGALKKKKKDATIEAGRRSGTLYITFSTMA